MSTTVFLPLFFIVNGAGFHQLLQKCLPVYNTLPFKAQQETVGRWNSFLTQIFLIIGSIFAKTNEEIQFFSEVLSAYLFIDTVHMLFYCYDLIYYIHHFIPVAIFYFGPPYFTPNEASSIFIAGAILELSSPPLSVAWFLSKMNIKPKGFQIFKIFVYLNFFFVRILYFPYYWAYYLNLGPKIVLAPFHFMNVYWFYSMTQYVMKSLKE